MASLSSTFTGRVVSVNDKGLKLEGHDTWANVSKFAPNVVLPQRGDTVTVCLDSKGFIRSLDIQENGPAPIRGGSDAPGAASGQHRDRTITRLAVLKAAAEYAASKPQSSSSDVLKIAASWERWINRSDDDELVDAF